MYQQRSCERSSSIRGAGPFGDAFNLVTVIDGVLRGVGGVVGDGVVDGGDVEVAEAEVAVTGLVGVGSPGGVSLVGEVVVIDLFGADEKALLLDRKSTRLN